MVVLMELKKQRWYFMNIINEDISYLKSVLKINQKIKCDNVFECKQILKKKLKEKYYNAFPLSNINSKNNFNSIYKYNYEYQRYDSTLSYKNFVETFYNIKKSHSKVLFCNSGMSAITSLLYSIYYSTNYAIEYSKDIYFETQKLIGIIYNNRNIRKKILFLDSISINFNFTIKNIKKYNIIVIDTTCFHSHAFSKIIKCILKLNKICILVRSHTKLDMLGLEYSTQGSITYLLPSTISKNNMNQIKKIIKFNLEFISNTGLGLIENNIFPLLNDEKTIKLNKNRIDRIVQNNKYFFENLKNIVLILPNHSLFTYLKIESKTSLLEMNDSLKKFCMTNNILCKYSPSFGFDYISLDTYYDYNSLNYTIRISIGDIDKVTLDMFINIFREYVNDLL